MTVLASSVGLRYVLPVTSAPSRTVDVRWASAASSVYSHHVVVRQARAGELVEVVHHQHRVEARAIGCLGLEGDRLEQSVGSWTGGEVRDLIAELGHEFPSRGREDRRLRARPSQGAAWRSGGGSRVRLHAACSIYIASLEGHSGKSPVALGLLDVFTRSVETTGVFRPVARSSTGEDPVLDLLLGHGGIDLAHDAHRRHVRGRHADPDAALATIVDRYRAIDRRARRSSSSGPTTPTSPVRPS